VTYDFESVSKFLEDKGKYRSFWILTLRSTTNRNRDFSLFYLKCKASTKLKIYWIQPQIWKFLIYDPQYTKLIHPEILSSFHLTAKLY